MQKLIRFVVLATVPFLAGPSFGAELGVPSLLSDPSASHASSPIVAVRGGMGSGAGGGMNGMSGGGMASNGGGMTGYAGSFGSPVNSDAAYAKQPSCGTSFWSNVFAFSHRSDCVRPAPALARTGARAR